eukprot:scaffold93432_cov43-Tisochrysis_lutea.AAC.1
MALCLAQTTVVPTAASSTSAHGYDRLIQHERHRSPVAAPYLGYGTGPAPPRRAKPRWTSSSFKSSTPTPPGRDRSNNLLLSITLSRVGLRPF